MTTTISMIKFHAEAIQYKETNVKQTRNIQAYGIVPSMVSICKS